MINTVVVAVDGSEHGHKAVEFAAELGRKQEARLMLVHALLRSPSVGDIREIAERFGFGDEVNDDLLALEKAALQTAAPEEPAAPPIVPDDLLKKVGTLVLEKTRSAIESGLPNIETVLSEEDPASAVVECAEKSKADIVVIGSRGFGRVKGLILGSVSQKVLQEVECACLVVK